MWTADILSTLPNHIFNKLISIKAMHLSKKEEEKYSDPVRPREPAETDNIDINADEIEVPIRAGREMAMDWQ